MGGQERFRAATLKIDLDREMKTCYSQLCLIKSIDKELDCNDQGCDANSYRRYRVIN
jgi:hypothetical protein